MIKFWHISCDIATKKFFIIINRIEKACTLQFTRIKFPVLIIRVELFWLCIVVPFTFVGLDIHYVSLQV
jgi:hypothetical protein